MTTISNLEAHGIPVTGDGKLVKTTTVVQNVDQLRSLLDHGFDQAGREAHYQALFGWFCSCDVIALVRQV
jgi:hypothetical protein